MAEIVLNRVHGDFGFEAVDQQGHVIRLDSSPDFGGENFGARPMQMLLMGLGGCAGIDVVSILKKGRQQVDTFRIVIRGEREQGKEPSLWKEATVEFQLGGRIDPAKARRACELSMEKYCSVAETLRRAGCEISWDVSVENVADAAESAA